MSTITHDECSRRLYVIGLYVVWIEFLIHFVECVSITGNEQEAVDALLMGYAVYMFYISYGKRSAKFIAKLAKRIRNISTGGLMLRLQIKLAIDLLLLVCGLLMGLVLLACDLLMGLLIDLLIDLLMNLLLYRCW